MCIGQQKSCLSCTIGLSAAFDTIDFDVLNERLANSLGINGTVRSWIMSYLQGRNSQVSIAGNLSEPQTMDFGLPQGSVVGPCMFSYYTYPLGKIIQKHNLKYHIYADDTQLYTEFNPRIPGDSVTALFKLESCITEIKQWMNVNKLKLNEDKTEFFVASSKSNLKFIHEPSLNVCGSIITSSDSVRNLGIIFDSTMSMSSHISLISRSLNYHLRNIGRIRCYIDEARAIMLYVHLLFPELTIVIHYYMDYLPKTCINYKKYKTELPDWFSKQIAESIPPLY